MKISDRQMILYLFESGLSAAQISTELGVPEYEVGIALDRFGHLKTRKIVDRVTYKKIFDLKAQGFSVDEVSLSLDISKMMVESAYQKDKSKIKNDARAAECLDLYKKGLSLEEISKKFQITRERVRQITKKQFGYELGYGPAEQKARADEITEKYRGLVVGSMGDRRTDFIKSKYEAALAKGFDPAYFDSFQKYAAASGVSKDKLKEYLPDVYRTLDQNVRAKSQRWSWHYEACVSCGTTATKHRGYGYCADCYSKSPVFKENQKRSHMRHRDSILANNRKYAEDYFNRPEVKARMEEEYDLKFFGGNRKRALERDGYMCLLCQMTTKEKDSLGRSKVRVWHIKDVNDHSLENLKTYCQSCLFKAEGISPRNKFGRIS